MTHTPATFFFHCERVKTAFLKVSKISFLENRKVPLNFPKQSSFVQFEVISSENHEALTSEVQDVIIP